MKLFIAGHSDSDATYLASGASPWPERTRIWLEQATNLPWELTGVRFAPMGPRAADYLLSAVEKAEPDIVIIPFTAYVCTIGVVGESVRVRFGSRAQRIFRRAEVRFDRTTRNTRAAKTANRTARKVTRAVFGARTLATVEQTASIYEEVLHRLAQRESLQVLAIADARFSTEVQAREPELHERIEQLYARIMPVAEQHHFVTADLEGALRRAPDRSVFYTPDGVHTTGAFHEVYFDVLQEALPPVLARLGSAEAVRPA